MFNSTQHCCIALNITNLHIPSELCGDWVSSYCLVIKHSKSSGRKFRESHFNHCYSSFNHLLVMTESHSLLCKASMCLFGGETVSKCRDQHRAHVTGWDAFGKD